MSRRDSSEKTKSEILDTALRLFQEKGWDNVNIEDIVRELGVTRGAFYHHFKSREALVVAVVDQMFFENNPFTLVAQEKGLSALEKLQFALQHNLDFNLKNNKDGMSRALGKAMEDPLIFKSEILSQINTVAPYIEELLIEGNEDGSLSVQYPKQAAEVLAILPSIWASPFVFPVSREELLDKMLFFQQLTVLLGIPLVNNEMIDAMKKVYETL